MSETTSDRTQPLAAPAPGRVIHAGTQASEWWRSAVIYQIYPRSFADGNGDGVGDLPGITARLEHLRDLGVDAVWISPFFTSPQADAGYDVADYCDVDPLFGSLADADDLLARAHALGLRVIIDIVANHTSDAHDWFQRALAAAPGSPERDWYVFRDADPASPDTPPNNWPSEFGGSAWSKTADGQWYLHLFDSAQPDLNWRSPEVREAFRGILRFWLDRGVDGFRIDVAHGLVKAEGLPDSPLSREALQADDVATHTAPYWDQDGVHEIYRDWHALLAEYPGERILVAEAWVSPQERLARYVRSGEHHQAFNFAFLGTRWRTAALRESITDSYCANDMVGAPTTWVLSNHDVIRHATRLALSEEDFAAQLGPAVIVPNAAVGVRRARAATTLMLALPGSAYLYQGEELGLPEVLDLPPEARQDPTFRRTAGERLGRDGCRVPVPWEKDAPSNGFSAAPAWLPQPESFAELAADQQAGEESSTLELYRRLLEVRRERGLGTGSLEQRASETDDLLALDVTTEAGVTRVLVNLGEAAIGLPDDAEVLAASAPLTGGALPQDAAAWLAL